MGPFARKCRRLTIWLLALTCVLNVCRLLVFKFVPMTDEHSLDERSELIQLAKGFFWQSPQNPPPLTPQREPTSLQTFQERSQRVQEACSAKSGTSARNPFRYHMMRTHPFSFCPVPKTGTTFWKRILYYVDKGFTGSLLSRSYGDIHGNSRYMENPHRRSRDLTYKKIVFVREPYGRLFSGYMSKLFVPRVPNWNKYARPAMQYSRKFATEHDHQCSHNVTFAEFVHYFIYTELGNNTWWRRNPHFIPVSKQCNFCGISYDFIGRQESFAEDTIGILTQLNRSSILSFTDFEKNVAAYEMNALIRYTYDHEIDLIANKRHCMSREEVLRRLWKWFQIHGTISAEEFFPLSVSETENITKEQFFAVALTAHNRTANDTTRRRNKMESLLEAYSTVPLQERLLLKQVFEDDFQFFGYKADHPAVFPPGDKFDLPYYRYFDVMDSFLKTDTACVMKPSCALVVTALSATAMTAYLSFVG